MENFIGKYCVVRARDASPHAGVVDKIDGRSVVMHDARRLWQWRVKGGKGISLSEVAEFGLDGDHWTRLGTPSTVLLQDACEVILCTTEAEASIRGIKSYVP